ncbi:hypothetical protein SODALDRAFT_266779 [Sodiomyces alkalinus F11]|uniref:Ricin B lectin domain-containing protein n=1 Tax=Sodiomyces alkalinus (strain CBS 110278 / VKM F-3762 / F11) TaxID=1314773 RepID=A0A3N2Q5K0_SODAK|nr:hypothetical protein SODALDRAFT_266779 [Sodiomyces alkalinus F11]ROT42050.1 hypothetical protein SODALDRAFT_266779 [Sodiomyces alkalinus F11]
MFTKRTLALALVAWLTPASASQTFPVRAVQEINEEATAQAHQRDETATRAFSDIQIQTSDGRCLFVDPLSGDFRANLTPVQVAECGSTDGQGWDVITEGIHNDRPGATLVVNTLTQACLNFDGRGGRVNLFSCGGRAGGGGGVTDSQLFAYEGGNEPLAFRPQNGEGQCLAVEGDALTISDCAGGEASQTFTFASEASEASTPQPTPEPAVPEASEPPTVTEAPADPTDSAPTERIPVSRAGGFLNPTAAAEAHRFDRTATRPVQYVSIRASTGQCVSVDPTAGDFRQNVIPLELVRCGGRVNEKFDLITAGRNNNGSVKGGALVTSVLTNGCVSTDGRRAADDNVTLFSCGGRAGGEGETDAGQLVRIDLDSDEFVWKPANGGEDRCIVPGDGRLVLGPCGEEATFTIIHVGPDA